MYLRRSRSDLGAVSAREPIVRPFDVRKGVYGHFWGLSRSPVLIKVAASRAVGALAEN